MTFLELEKKCKQRRFKKYFFIFIVLLFIAVGGFFVFKETKKTVKKPDNNKTVFYKKPKFDLKPKLTKTQNKQKLKKIQNEPKLSLIIDLNITNEVKKPQKIKNKEPKKEPKNFLSSNTLPSYETCISLAKKYLQEGNYKESFKWAKYANIQNKKAPASWILSAEALYKMGQKQKALKILKIYYNYYPDKEVKKLIGKLSEKTDN